MGHSENFSRCSAAYCLMVQSPHREAKHKAAMKKPMPAPNAMAKKWVMISISNSLKGGGGVHRLILLSVRG
jgi:hypothetical protein